jgi:hypothetical protein
VIGLVIERSEPFTDVIDAPEMPYDADAVDLKDLYVGENEFGGDWRLGPLGQHIFVAGATGAGKNSIAMSMLRGLAPLIRDGLVRLWLCDPKQMEFSKLRGIAYRYADDAVRAAQARLGAALGRGHELAGRAVEGDPALHSGRLRRGDHEPRFARQDLLFRHQLGRSRRPFRVRHHRRLPGPDAPQARGRVAGTRELRMWGYPWLSWLTLALAGTLVVVVSMAFVDDARSQLLLSVISLAAILGIYLMLRRSAGSAHRTTHP